MKSSHFFDNEIGGGNCIEDRNASKLRMDRVTKTRSSLEIKGQRGQSPSNEHYFSERGCKHVVQLAIARKSRGLGKH